MLKRPLLFFTSIYCFGILYAQFFNRVSFIVLLFLFFVCAVLFAKNRNKIYLLFCLGLAVFLSGAIYSYYKSVQESDSLEPFSGTTLSFTAQVVSQPDIRENKVNYTVLIKKIEHNKSIKEVKNKILLSVYFDTPKHQIFKYGDLIKGTGKLQLPSTSRNSGGFNYKRFLASQNIYSTVTTLSTDIIYTGKAKLNPFIRFSLSLRDKITKTIDNSLPKKHAELLKGLVIGERNGLPQDIKDNFNISGLTHILCVSGANIAYIAGACIFILGLIGIKNPYSNLITISILIIFTYITGSSPSVVRAAIMGIMLLSAGIFYRKTDTLTSISAACLIMLIYNPLIIYDIGFQLSFAGTIGIVAFYKNLFNYLKFLPKLLNQVLSVSLAAQLTVNPIIAFYFNKISLIAIISNIVVVPLTGITTIIGLIMSTAGSVSIFLAKIIGGLNYFSLSFILWVSEASAKIPFATIQVITPKLITILLYYMFLYILLWYIPTKKPGGSFYKKLSCFSVCMTLFLVISYSIPKPLQISFLDIGQGDCNFIKTPSGKTCLIDGGGKFPGTRTNFDVGNTIIPFLLDNGVSSLDLMILSHAHGDHIQGLIKVINASFSVKKMVIGPQFEQNADLDTLLELCRIKRIEVVQVSKNSSVYIDGIELKVLHPLSTNHFIQNSSLNNNSLVLKLIYKNTDILFTGDIEADAEKELLDSNTDISADILKIAHHGSRNSTSQEFLKAVSPSVCIISVGKNNFGHPSKDVISRISYINSKLYRTDIDGGINIRIYNNRFSIIPSVIK